MSSRQATVAEEEGQEGASCNLGYLVNAPRTLDSAQWTSSPIMLASRMGWCDSSWKEELLLPPQNVVSLDTGFL